MIIKYFQKYGILDGFRIILSKIIYKILKKPIRKIFSKRLKVNSNRILFYSVPDYSDNARALYDYMNEIKEYKKYEFIWLVEHPESHVLEELKKQKQTTIIKSVGKWHQLFTFKALYYTMTSKYLFYTHGSPVYEDYKNKEQIAVNLWHGCGYKQKTKEKQQMRIQPHSDYYLIPGELFREPKREFWDCNLSQLLTLGYPRYDVLLSESLKAKKYLEGFRKNNSTKVIIWMPTFRKVTINGDYPEAMLSKGTALPLLDTEEELSKMNALCEAENITLLIKKHPLQAEYESTNLKLRNIYFINETHLNDEKIQLYEVLHYTDALISDYSSISIDYLLLNKPIGFLLNDFKDYKDLRGFIFEDPLIYMPGHHIYNVSDFVKFIKDISMDKDLYLNERNNIRNMAHNEVPIYSQAILDYVGI